MRLIVCVVENENFLSHAEAQRQGSALGGSADLKQLPRKEL
ncbi:hypothetical protein [Nostoc piscinale]|nr:hypothetical protein [Nostoc piscinale]